MNTSILTFVNTRPTHQAETLNQLLLKTFNANIINLPTLEIEPFQQKQTKQYCQQLEAFDIAIFVSANAAHWSHEYWPLPFPIHTVIAVGSGTKKTLEQYGIKNVHLPNKFNSAGILKLPELSNVHKKRILIFCGKDSKTLLYKSLTQKGGIVSVCECYKRIHPTPNPNTLTLLKSKKLQGIISTSKTSLINLNMFLKNNTTIKKTPLIVISDDMKKLATNLGWEQVVVAKSPSNAAIVETLRDITYTRNL